MTQNEKIWEHRITKNFNGVEKKEPPKAFLYFQCYAKLGTKRSIRKVSEIYDKGEAHLRRLSVRWDWVKRATEYDEYIIKKALDEVEDKHVNTLKLCASIVHDLFEDILENLDDVETTKKKADLLKALKPYYPDDLLNNVFKESDKKDDGNNLLLLCDVLHKNKPNPKEKD